MEYERQFAHPLHKILYCDVTGDGLNELVVLSTAGLHLLQVHTAACMTSVGVYSSIMCIV